MGFFGFFDDKKRKRIRRRAGASFFADYFFRSEVTDYKRLRYVVNGLIGILICSVLYYLGWKRLNFGDFHPVYGILLKWAMIGSIAATFTVSSLFRCATICVLLGALGKNGQAPLTLLIMNGLNEGPIQNIIHNYKLTAEIIVCHLQLQARIMSNRIAMFTGPMEDLLKKQLDRGLKVLKHATRFVRKLIAPFLSEIKPEKTKEDVVMDKAEKQLTILSQRRALGVHQEDELSEEEMRNITDTAPGWASFKTDMGRKIAERISKRCNEIFTKGVDKCRELFGTLQKKCFDALPTGVNWFVCRKLNMESSCQDLDRHRQSISFCRSHLEKSNFGSSMEGDVKEVVNMTKELDKELRVNLHVVAVESARVEVDYSLNDITLLIKAALKYAMAILKTTKQVIMTLFVFYVYKIFSNTVQTIDKYNNNVEFNNHFIGRVFWMIDEFRQKKGQEALVHIDRSEKKQWKVMNVFGKPSKQELQAARQPFFRWLLLTFIVVILLLVDFYIWDFLNQVVTTSETAVQESAEETAQIIVTGEGVVADFLNKMIGVNKTIEKDEQLTNEHCLSYPKKPDFLEYSKWIIIPLIASLIMQVVFAFFVKRVILNFFLPFMFPKRDRVRLIYLYNKLLYLRTQHRREARARIRFTAQRWKIHEEFDGGWITSKSWVKLQIVDRIFKTGQCLLCHTYMRPSSLRFCARCPATFCKFCVKEIHERCYACQVEDREVTSQRTQYIPPEANAEAKKEAFLGHVKKAKSGR